MLPIVYISNCFGSESIACSVIIANGFVILEVEPDVIYIDYE